MSDGWEDWEDSENIPLNEEQLKMLEERKLVEESDKSLARDLCKNNKEHDLEKMKSKNVIIEKSNKINNQKINEDKMKELSEKNKANKGEKELFREEEYEDKFY
jgi:hypothetical protein